MDLIFYSKATLIFIFFKIYCELVCTHVLWHICDQGKLSGVSFFLLPLHRLGIKPKVPGLHSEYLYLLSHLVDPILIYYCVTLCKLVQVFCLHVCLCTISVQFLWRPEEGIRSPVVGVIGVGHLT